MKPIPSLAAAAAAMLLFPGAAPAQPRDSIPFINYGAIRSWTAENNSTIDVQTASKKWYRVNLTTDCFGLTTAMRVGFDTGPMDTLDSFTSIIVDGQRCPVRSVEMMSSPPNQNGEKSK